MFIVNNKTIGLADEGMAIRYAKSTLTIKIFEIGEASFLEEHPKFWLFFYPNSSLSPAIRSRPVEKQLNQILLLHLSKEIARKNLQAQAEFYQT